MVKLRFRAIHVLPVILVVASCATHQAQPDPPPSPPPVVFYSPFLKSGTLTEWAETAIKRGIGIQIHPGVAPYPDGRVIQPDKKYTRKEQEEDQRVADRSANLVGGWAHIAETSDQTFERLEELALSMFVNNSDNVKYAEAVAATMMMYPELRATYYQTVSGGDRRPVDKKQTSRGGPNEKG